MADLDKFGEWVEKLVEVGERCDRCGIEIVKHQPLAEHRVIDRGLYVCKKCGAILCSLQAGLFGSGPTVKGLHIGEVGVHLIFPPRRWGEAEAGDWVLSFTKEEETEMKKRVICGYVIECSGEADGESSGNTEAQNESSSA